MLLAVTAHPEIARIALAGRGWSAPTCAPASVALLPPGSARVRMPEWSYTSHARRVIELTAQEAGGAARDLRAARFLAAIRGEGGPAAHLLREMGIGTDPVASADFAAAAAPEIAPAALALEIDETSARSIVEQIVAGVQEEVATGRLRPGERLPSVRRLADQLDVAPGTVARAYAELERLSMVVTDGARGTRVAERAAPAAPNVTEALEGLLRPVVVAAFHMGATLDDLRHALVRAERDILPGAGDALRPDAP